MHGEDRYYRWSINNPASSSISFFFPWEGDFHGEIIKEGVQGEEVHC